MVVAEHHRASAISSLSSPGDSWARRDVPVKLCGNWSATDAGYEQFSVCDILPALQHPSFSVFINYRKHLLITVSRSLIPGPGGNAGAGPTRAH